MPPLFYQEFDGFIGRFEDVPYVNEDTQTVTAGGFTLQRRCDGLRCGSRPALADQRGLDCPALDERAAGRVRRCRRAVPRHRLRRYPGQRTRPVGGELGGPRPVAFCQSSDPISNLPDWSTTLQSEYVIPRDSLEYYVRGLLNYQPENDNFATGFERDSFALLNLYAGVRSGDGRWDVTLWAKNALDDDTLLDQFSEGVLAGFNSGYRGVIVQPGARARAEPALRVRVGLIPRVAAGRRLLGRDPREVFGYPAEFTPCRKFFTSGSC